MLPCTSRADEKIKESVIMGEEVGMMTTLLDHGNGITLHVQHGFKNGTVT